MKTIRVFDVIGRYPILGSFADALFDQIEGDGEDHIVVDFDGVDFITETFARRYAKRIDECDVKVDVTGEYWEIKKMFEMIKNQ